MVGFHEEDVAEVDAAVDCSPSVLVDWNSRVLTNSRRVEWWDGACGGGDRRGWKAETYGD